jgi:hypothetical protein
MTARLPARVDARCEIATARGNLYLSSEICAAFLADVAEAAALIVTGLLPRF